MATLEEGALISCHSVELWQQLYEKHKQIKKLLVVDFTASWCGPCRMMAPIFAELAKKFPDVIFVKIDVDELKSIAEDFSVEAMPTFMFLRDGEVVDRIVGASKDELPKKIETLRGPAA
ncbi:thioredoxin H1 [Lactuca sativa]|uniref:Thioredoxin domain-containing protein n=1 Tax=Lactuca sativa TaxID=4236 RepID=A0A9R1VKQ1_LACSA|nr:thioredoxin H1 [Lactuca sativa]KAJ0206411.1 hypothetical protein LSAT_V11C500264770 [Lactuca sativa]